jgi:hypothetical protein
LESLSGDASQDYFADGMTDELITNLGQIRSLRVISRTSAMMYKHAHKPLPEIARELDVEAVVEGTVLRAGDQVRISEAHQTGRAAEPWAAWAMSCRSCRCPAGGHCADFSAASTGKSAQSRNCDPSTKIGRTGSRPRAPWLSRGGRQ